MTSNMKAVLLVVGFSAVGWAACGAQGEQTANGPVVIHRGEWNGDDGAARGELVLEDNCLYFIPTSLRPAPIGDQRLILAFARGAEWDAATQSIHYDGLVLSPGPDAFVGGGPIDEDTLPGWINPPDPSCEWDGIWYMSDAGVRQ